MRTGRTAKPAKRLRKAHLGLQRTKSGPRPSWQNVERKKGFKVVESFAAAAAVASAAIAGVSAWFAFEQHKGSATSARNAAAQVTAAQSIAGSAQKQAEANMEQVSQVSRLVRATSDQVTTANAAGRMMDAAYRRQDRAYVNVVSAQLTQIAADQPLRANAVLVNSGRSPALNFRIVRSLDVRDYPDNSALPAMPSVRASPPPPHGRSPRRRAFTRGAERRLQRGAVGAAQDRSWHRPFPGAGRI